MLRLQFKFDNLKTYENLIYFKVTGTLSMKIAKKNRSKFVLRRFCLKQLVEQSEMRFFDELPI